jgi:hypothetical protein
MPVPGEARTDCRAHAPQVDASQRLGCMAGGAADVRAHVWFQGTAWDVAAAYRLPPPIRCAWHVECGAPLRRPLCVPCYVRNALYQPAHWPTALDPCL